MPLRVNAIVPQDGQEFIVIPHVRPELMVKTVRRNVLAKMKPPAITSQVRNKNPNFFLMILKMISTSFDYNFFKC